MPNQAPHPSGKVVSVRLDETTIERLDTLCDRTGRTRGFYLKLAIRTMVPVLEQQHWEQRAAEFEEDVIDRKFREIMSQAMQE